ncbi:MAG: sigma-70 family RNA polymerase sigma factor, partial [Planctomycetes bacterium]|nr:sigma-70 family RNA polymerase sigma factor [Planctomycetota bacterium]
PPPPTAPPRHSAEGRFVAFARDRDQRALEQILAEHLPASHAHAVRMLGNHADADDALQEAVTRLVVTSGAYDGSVPFRAWLGRLVSAAITDQLRARRRRSRFDRRLDDGIGATSGKPAVSPEVAALRRELQAMHEDDRTPLELHYFAQLSHEEIARALDLTVEAATKRIQRARKRLGERLKRPDIAGILVAVPALAPEAEAMDALLERVLEAAASAEAARAATTAAWAIGIALVVAATLALGGWLLLRRPGAATAPPAAELPVAASPPAAAPPEVLPQPAVPVAPAARGELSMMTSYPRLTLGAAAPGSPDSQLTLELGIMNRAAVPASYQVVVDGVGRGIVAAPTLGLSLPKESWTVTPGRHRIEVRLDPADEIREDDERDNRSVIIVDVPIAVVPIGRVGADLAFAYPPYVTYVPMEPANGPQAWAFAITVPMRNNGTTVIDEMIAALSGDQNGRLTDTGTFAPGDEQAQVSGRGAGALERLRVVITLDPDGRIAEVDEANAFALDVTSPPAELP